LKLLKNCSIEKKKGGGIVFELIRKKDLKWKKRNNRNTVTLLRDEK